MWERTGSSNSGTNYIMYNSRKLFRYNCYLKILQCAGLRCGGGEAK